ncbi:stage II sporulation protein B [Bacillus manliponensis]|uniref:stage II sporulation protein B n=1 Tax=Bacillus manliponensis TaxID=574376 RepID=UPI003514A149
MDKQSRTISVKVNGTEAKYVERKKEKEEFEWMLPEASTIHNVVPFQKGEKIVSGKEEKEGSYKFVIVISTAVLIGTGFGMGMIQLFTEGSTKQQVAPAVNTTSIQEPKQEPKQGQKQSVSMPLPVLSLYFVQGGAFSTKEKGEEALAEWKEKGFSGTLKLSGDKYLLVMGMTNDENTIDTLIADHKKKGMSVLKKKWEITDSALLKEDKQYGSLLLDVQSLYTALVAYVGELQAGEKIDKKEIQAIEKKWGEIEEKGKTIKREDIRKLLTYTSVAVQTVKTEKKDVETLTKLEKIIIDGLLSYEKIVSEKEKTYNN